MKKLIRTLAVATTLVATTIAFAQNSHAKISPQKAQSVALAKYPGKVVGKVELENEEGTWQYAVMVRSGKVLREVMVNAKTGKIDNVEVTTDSKEAKEKAAEVKAKKPAKTKSKGKGH